MKKTAFVTLAVLILLASCTDGSNVVVSDTPDVPDAVSDTPTPDVDKDDSAPFTFDFTPCTSDINDINVNNDTDEKIYFELGSMTAGTQYILYPDGGLKYIDLTTGDMTKYPLCSKPNCEHNKGDCAAFSLRYAKYPFIYNGKLYYFTWDGGDVGLHQADTDGTNQKTIFKAEEDYFLYDPLVRFFNGNLIFIIYKDYVDNAGHKARNYRFYIYDFTNVSLFFETGVKYDLSIIFYGMIGDDIYFEYRGRDYSVDIPFEKWHEYVSDENSVYYQDLIIEKRKMPLKQKTPSEPEYEVIYADNGLTMLGDCYYYITVDDKVVRVVPKTGESDIVFTVDDSDTWIHSSGVYDGRLFIKTNKSGSNRRAYYYNGSEFVPSGPADGEGKFDIWFDVGDYFWGSIFTTAEGLITKAYIKKTDYYNGNWEGIVQFEW